MRQSKPFDLRTVEELAARYKEIEENPQSYTLGAINGDALSELHELETKIHCKVGVAGRDKVFADAEQIRRMVVGPKPKFRKWNV